MTAYYNENDPAAAAWLRALIAANLIAPGDVDERSILDVKPDDLAGYNQCHFFAGIGGWSHALRLAGWPDDRPVWTGSCPCQPFSAAGRGGGFADERHLWPAWYHLISQRRPSDVFGEQVASKDGLEWFDLVSSDMEGAGYATVAADLCAAGLGAPHIRQRLWFYGRRLAYGDHERLGGRVGMPERTDQRASRTNGMGGGMADGDGRESRQAGGVQPRGQYRLFTEMPGVGGMGHADGQDVRGEPGGRDRSQGNARHRPLGNATRAPDCLSTGEPAAGPTNGFWRDADWLLCRDGKWRPIEPGTFPLADGIPDRVGLLRGYGNAIVPQVAATFIGAVMPG